MKTLSIQAYYQKDHDRLDALFKAFQGLKRRDVSSAQKRFREFKTGLQRHIVWEEEILFPLFESKTGLRNAGPTEVMRMEHRQIKRFLDAMHDKVQQRNIGTEAEETALLDTLGAHNEKEEQILYPAIDRLLSDEERREVFTRMERVPRAAYDRCCEEHSRHR